MIDRSWIFYQQKTSAMPEGVIACTTRQSSLCNLKGLVQKQCVHIKLHFTYPRPTDYQVIQMLHIPQFSCPDDANAEDQYKLLFNTVHTL